MVTDQAWAREGFLLGKEGDCRALRKVQGGPHFTGAPACLHNTQGCCQGVQVTFFAAGSRLNRLEVTGLLESPAFVLLRGLLCEKAAFVLEVYHMCACLGQLCDLKSGPVLPSCCPWASYL